MKPRPITISSADNPAFRRLLALLNAKGIRAQGQFLAGGAKLLAEIIRSQANQINSWIGTPAMAPPPPAAGDCRWLILAPERFKEINSLGTPGPLVTLRTPARLTFNPQAPWPPGCSLFIPLGDPENVGAVIRAAAGLGAARVILLREAACPFLPRAIRASAGALWQIRLEYGPALKELVAAAAAPLWALDPAGTPLELARPPARFGLLVGQEGQGLPQEIRQGAKLLSIALANQVESLNAASAAAIALWAWRR